MNKCVPLIANGPLVLWSSSCNFPICQEIKLDDQLFPLMRMRIQNESGRGKRLADERLCRGPRPFPPFSSRASGCPSSPWYELGHRDRRGRGRGGAAGAGAWTRQ